MRRFALLVGTLCTALWSGSAAAEDCPDGDWFCDTTPIADEPSAVPADTSDPPPEAQPAGQAPSGVQPRRSVRIDVERVRPAVPRKHRRLREWGVNLHATLGLLGDDAAAADADMNGIGAALRLRLVPHVALEGSLELVWGVDYNGFDRFEHAALFNALFFVNPRSAVQLYGVAGFGLSGAYVDSSDENGLRRRRDERYRYLGAQLGVGVEARVTRHFALGGDLIGFLRERADRHADDDPEFVDPVTLRATNSSGGGIVRLGATYYW
jgi:hypothetical protein